MRNAPTFTAHPIRLKDGLLTIPDETWDMSQHPVFLTAKDAINGYSGGNLAEVSIIDLGCLEGGYTIEFARLGMQATGLEVRDSNLTACRYAASKIEPLPNLKFVKDDCRNLANHGHFDVAFCCGLLYHLDKPAAFLRTLRENSNLLILDTHFATMDKNENFPLSPIETNEGYTGRWFAEYDSENKTKDDSARWTSWENRRSFWPLDTELKRALTDAGYSILQWNVREPKLDRVFIVAAASTTSGPSHIEPATRGGPAGA